MKHLDLFSGIGGFALAASRVWPNHEVVAFCEIDKFCQKVLRKHWPGVPIFDDIKTLKGSDFDTVELISGGFPCQGFSVAGKRRGKEDDRYLWPEMFRIIKETNPRWVLGENVNGIINMALDDVLFDLESLGYETTAVVLPACAVNAPHRRDRVWIVGHANQFNGNGSGPCSGEISQFKEAGIQRRHAANATQQLSHRTRNTGPGRREEYSDGGGDAADTGNQGLPQPEQQTICRSRRGQEGRTITQCHGPWSEPWIEAATRLCGIHDGISRRVDRTARLKALGNAIVPQVAEQIFKAIRAVSQ